MRKRYVTGYAAAGTPVDLKEYWAKLALQLK